MDDKTNDSKKEAAAKVDVVKIKFPDVITTRQDRAIGFSCSHSYITTKIELIVGENRDRKSLIIRNIEAETVWISSNVGMIGGTDGNAFPLRQWETITFTHTYGAVYAKTQANTSVVAIIEE